MIDPTNAQKDYSFGGTGGGSLAGLVTVITDRPGSGLPSPRRQDFTWVQDSAGNPSISAVLTTLDEGQTYQKQSKRQQTIDTHGSVTQVKMYDFGSLATPARVYDNVYTDAAALTSRHIWNRLASSVLSGGGQSVTLVSNSYDGYGNQLCVILSNVDQPQNLREHDSSNYGAGFTARGNVTQTTAPGVTQCFSYNMTGACRCRTARGR